MNRDGTYDIRYEDGDRESGVKADYIRSLGGGIDKSSSASSSFREGDAVEARFGGRDKWFKGKITNVNRDGTYDIRYDDGDRESGVKADYIRSLGGGSDRPSSASSFREAEDVEARFGGRDKWYKGKITNVNRDGTYDIRCASHRLLLLWLGKIEVYINHMYIL